MNKNNAKKNHEQKTLFFVHGGVVLFVFASFFHTLCFAMPRADRRNIFLSKTQDAVLGDFSIAKAKLCCSRLPGWQEKHWWGSNQFVGIQPQHFHVFPSG